MTVKQASSPRTRFAPYRFAYGATAVTYVALQAFTTLPSPLYGLYAVRDHLSSLMITLIYAAYAVGVAASLVLAGHLSDTLGRKPILFAALMTNCVSATVFVLAPSLPGLVLARVISGLAVGVTASTATAYLGELFAAHRPIEQIDRARLLAAAASVGGLGAGALLGGVVAQTAGHPLVAPYLVMIALLIACAVALVPAPETRRAARPRAPYRPQRLAVPAHARSRFAAALAGVAAVFSLFGLFVGLAATLLRETLHRSSPVLSGAVLFVVFGVGALATVTASRMGRRAVVPVSGTLMLAGTALLVLSAWLPHPGLTVFVISAAVIGAGGAGLFTTSLTVATALAPRDHVAGTVATFFLAGYGSLSLPVIGIGIALRYLSVRVTLFGFAILVAIAVVAALPGLFRTAER